MSSYILCVTLHTIANCFFHSCEEIIFLLHLRELSNLQWSTSIAVKFTAMTCLLLISGHHLVSHGHALIGLEVNGISKLVSYISLSELQSLECQLCLLGC